MFFNNEEMFVYLTVKQSEWLIFATPLCNEMAYGTSTIYPHLFSSCNGDAVEASGSRVFQVVVQLSN